MTQEQRIAREWLTFLVCFIAGLVLAYLVLYSNTPVGTGQYMKYKNPGDMFNDLTSRGGLIPWVITLAPYIAVSIARSIVWAVKALRVS